MELSRTTGVTAAVTTTAVTTGEISVINIDKEMGLKPNNGNL